MNKTTLLLLCDKYTDFSNKYFNGKDIPTEGLFKEPYGDTSSLKWFFILEHTELSLIACYEEMM